MTLENKKLFVHCGLHKTGTTVLQKIFTDQEEKLRQLGLLYPKSGRLDPLGGGHHGIAWQLSQDRRYAPNQGCVAELLEELAAFDGDALISSEDFETLLDTPGQLNTLVEALLPSGREIVMVIYLRNQLSYCQSMFIENINQSIGTDFPSYVREITQYGRLRLREWVFQFDYRKLLSYIEALPVKLIVRNFHTLDRNSSVTDMLGVVGIEPHKFGVQPERPRDAPGRPADRIPEFIAARVGRKIDQADVTGLAIMRGIIGVRRFIISDETVNAFSNVFGEGNLELCARHGLASTGLEMRKASRMHERETCLYFEHMYSSQTQSVLLRMRNSLLVGKLDKAGAMAREYIIGEQDRLWSHKQA